MFENISDTVLISFFTLLTYIMFFINQILIFSHFGVPSLFIKIEVEFVLSTLVGLFVVFLMLSFLIDGVLQFIPNNLPPTIKSVLRRDIIQGIYTLCLILSNILPNPINQFMIGLLIFILIHDFVAPLILFRKIRGIRNKYFEFYKVIEDKATTNYENSNEYGTFQNLNKLSPRLNLLVVITFISIIVTSIATQFQISNTNEFRVIKNDDGEEYIHFSEYNSKLVSKRYIEKTNTIEREIFFVDLDDIDHMYLRNIYNPNIEK